MNFNVIGVNIMARPYHHGDLKRVLIDVALTMVVEEGNCDFGLREVARRAGVSSAAPYKHFADKGALLAEVAARGFDALADRMEAARTRCAGSDEDRLVAIGCAYVEFGVERPAHYRLMFGAVQAAMASSNLAEADARAWRVLESAIAELPNAVPQTGPDRGLRALTAWAAVHGLTSLIIDGREGIGGDPGQLAEAVGRLMLAGLVN